MKLSLAVSTLFGVASARELLDHMQKKVELDALVDKEKARANAVNWKGMIRQRGEVPCVDGTIGDEYDCLNMNFVNFLSAEDLGTESEIIYVNDIWGWTDPVDGKEYSLVGLYDGISLVDISNPRLPKVIGFINATDNFVDNGGRWHDIKVVNDVAYIGSEITDHGIQVFDLTRLRDLARSNYKGNIPRIEPDYVAREVGSTHNIVAAPEAGKIIGVGLSPFGISEGNTNIQCPDGSMAVFDVAGDNALSPVFEECYFDGTIGWANFGYVHDAHCIQYNGPDVNFQGENLCVLFAEKVVSIMSLDTNLPISQITYPSAAYIHQGWFSEDQTTIFVDDELDELFNSNFVTLPEPIIPEFEEALGFIGLNAEGIKNSGINGFSQTYIVDASDLSDLSIKATFKSPVQSVDHNLYVKGDKIYHANYASGARVRQMAGDTIQEVAFFDMQVDCDDYNPSVCSPFTGVWTHYPYYESGLTTASSIYEGLFILRPTV